MIKENSKEFNYLGIIKWHKKGFTGKGIKILVMDNNYDIKNSHIVDKVITVDNWGQGGTNTHGLYVCDIVSQILPEATIYFGSYFPRTLQFAMDNDIDVVTMSMGHIGSDDFLTKSKELISRGTVLCASAGNKGLEGLTMPAPNSSWIAVGACRLNDGNLVRANYSSVGKELEVMSLTDIYVNSANGYITPFRGTSCATPVFASIVSLLLQKIGKIPLDELRPIIYSYCEDLEDKGFDNNTGYGLFRLPDPDSLKQHKKYYGKGSNGQPTVTLFKGNSPAEHKVWVNMVDDMLKQGYRLHESITRDKLEELKNKNEGIDQWGRKTYKYIYPKTKAEIWVSADEIKTLGSGWIKSK